MKKINLIILVLTLSIFPFNSLLAQTKGFSTFETESLFKDNSLTNLSTNTLNQTDGFTFGSIIYSDFYKLGPGDVLLYQNLLEEPNQQYIYVSPECKIFIPRIGELDILGKSLTDVKKLVLEAVKQKNLKNEGWISLYKPRNVMVTINGNVLFPGTYILPSSYRISNVINIANAIPSNKQFSPQHLYSITQNLERQKQLLKNFSGSGVATIPSTVNRNITVLHSNGTSSKADIEKSIAINTPEFDPYISESDIIFVPFEDEFQPTIAISGAVHRPIITSFQKGDKASLLLKLGFGLRDDADLNNVILYSNENKEQKLQIDSAMNLIGEDIELQAGNYIVVGVEKPQQIKQHSAISVMGLVKKPGVFRIEPGKTRLKDVIALAGGFQENASLSLSMIVRNTFTQSNIIEDNIFKNFQYSDLTMEDTARFKLDMMYRQNAVSCDFIKCFEHNSDENNVLLEDRDVIIVPSIPTNIYVYGQVNNPGFVVYEPGKTMQWYIEKAGDFAVGASESRSRIIKGRTKVWLEADSKAIIEPGDEIYVPRPPDLPPGIESQKFAAIATTLAAVVSVINLIYYIFKQ